MSQGWPWSRAPAWRWGRPCPSGPLHHWGEHPPCLPKLVKGQLSPLLPSFLCALPIPVKREQHSEGSETLNIYIYPYLGMCVCKQTDPPYVYARLRDVNRHGARQLIELSAESGSSSGGLCLSPAGAQHMGAGHRAGEHPVVLRGPLPGSWERLSSGHLALPSAPQSKTTAANAQQKEVSESHCSMSDTAVSPAHPAPVASQPREGVPGPRCSAQVPPSHLSTRH